MDVFLINYDDVHVRRPHFLCDFRRFIQALICDSIVRNGFISADADGYRFNLHTEDGTIT